MNAARGFPSLEIELDERFAEASARAGDHAQSRHWLLPAISGFGYASAWIAGLFEWPSNLAIDSTGRQVVGLYSDHPSQAAVQYLLVEGVAGILLGTTLFYLLHEVRRRSPDARLLGATVLGWVSAALSVLQCVLGLILISSATIGDVISSGDIFALVNRLDGVKQLLLCAIIWLAVRLRRILPLWLRRVAWILAATLLPSGLAYLFLANDIAWTASLALPFLSLFIGGSGLGHEDQAKSVVANSSRRVAIARVAAMSAATIAPRLDHLTQTPALQRRTTGRPLNGSASLVNKSPVVYTLQSERYHLLETIRAFAWTRLDRAGDADQAALRHMRWCAALAEPVWARRRMDASPCNIEPATMHGMATTTNARASHRGQTSLPADLRHRWGIEAGGEIGFIDLGHACPGGTRGDNCGSPGATPRASGSL